MINTILGISNLQVAIWNNGKINVAGVTTLLLMVVNIIVLLRINISLYIQGSLMECEIKMELSQKQKPIIDKIKIAAIDKRISLIKNCYYIDGTIYVLNLIFRGNKIGPSLCIIVFLSIVMTLFNNIIDISKTKYMAKERVFFEVSYNNTMKGV